MPEPQLTTPRTELRTLLLDVGDDGVAVLTVNRPDRANSQTVTMFHEFGEAALALRDSGARALVVRGAGERAFCTGFDLAEIDVLREMGPLEFLAFQELAANGIAALRALPFPVIAAVHGPAAGGGMSLALAADIRLAAPSAKFALSFVKVGLSIGELGTSWTLSRLVGPGIAAELAFTGRTVEAAEAARIGLVNRVVDDPVAEAHAVAAAVARNSPGGVRLSKRALQAGMEVGSYAAAMELENRGQALLTRAADFPEALAAFREGRPPVWTGR
ncbi:enoyl-CoA hydratase/isomerase family protein [Pseudonocardia broussonetiae]|uniref:Enoyl-CoA hydratase/isomerase family protein n=1 Tax=Pseudonocardia broussonetiae TaxID=2736640 RepID=A0A6M6JME4_9PSEU|nr:enoyl-CoA hydratase-related protein [Pseudonocardia broussonetiae]QJY48250.1 enoyl-CoA hydratase/isomerase family protein [Pseudonocardia broussonetiae]